MANAFSETPLISPDELQVNNLIVKDNVYFLACLLEIEKKLNDDTFFVSVEEQYKRNEQADAKLSELAKKGGGRRFTWHPFHISDKFRGNDTAFELIDEFYNDVQFEQCHLLCSRLPFASRPEQI